MIFQSNDHKCSATFLWFTVYYSPIVCAVETVCIIGHSRSLKMVPFQSLGTISYSPSIVTMAVSVAVCDIFSVKEWPDVENRVRVRSRSLEMSPIDRSHTSLNT